MDFDENVLHDSATCLSVSDVDDLFASEQVLKSQQLCITYIKNPKRFAKLYTNPDAVEGHVDVLLTRGALAVLLPQFPFRLHDSELYAKITMRPSCPMSKKLLLPVNHIITKFYVGCFGAILAQGVKCEVDGSHTPKLNASMVVYDPYKQKKYASYTITISLVSEDEPKDSL